MAPHSSTLAWRIPWMEEPGGLQSMGSLWVGHNWATSLSPFTFMHWRRKWQPTPVFLPGESQGGELGGLPSMASHRIRYNWSGLAAAAAARHYDISSKKCESVSHSIVSHSANPWTVAHQTYLSMRFPRQEYWTALPFPTQELNLGLLHCRQILYCLSHDVKWKQRKHGYFYFTHTHTHTHTKYTEQEECTNNWTNKWDHF